MNASNSCQYTTFCSDNAHEGIQINHEEVFEPTDEYIVQQDLTEVSNGNINQDIIEAKVVLNISHENPEDKPYSFACPIYMKKDMLTQLTTGDESMAIEALRQLKGMQPNVQNKKSSCSKCANMFTQTELIKHYILCQSDKHICKICGKIFQKKVELNNHMICHKIEHSHSCRTCGNLFCSKAYLQAHIIEVHQGKQVHKCKVCGTDFQRPSSLSNHMKIHSYVAGRALAQIQPNITVQIIGRVINDSNSQEAVLTATQTVQHSEIPQIEWTMKTHNFTNDKNNIDTLISSSSNQEVNMFPTEEDAQFEYILQDTVNLEVDHQYHLNLSLHNNSDTSIKLLSVDSQTKNNLYFCNKCNISFSNGASLIEHEKNHIKNKWESQSKCEYCDEQFQDFDFLKVHQISCVRKLIQNNQKNPKTKFSNIKWNKYACPKCGKKFTTKQKMFRHQWIHRKKTYSCETCNSQFEKQLELDEHRLLTHPTESPFTCTECGKSFVSRQGLWEHGRTHAGSPAHFYCDTCSKTFSSRQGYLIHHRTHTGERPYGCKFCWKAFRDGGTLRKHERIHTGERPHVCPLCSRAFNQKVVLREHVRWVHAAKNDIAIHGPPFSCPICDNLIQDRDELCAHIVKHSDLIVAQAKAKRKCPEMKNKVKNKNKKYVTKQAKFKHTENIEAQMVHNKKQGKALSCVTQHAGNSNKIEDTCSIPKGEFDDSFCLQVSPNKVFRDDRSTKAISKITISKILDLKFQENTDILHKESGLNIMYGIPLTKKINTLTLISKHNENLPVLSIPNSPNFISFSNRLSNIDMTLPSKTRNIEPITKGISLDNKNKRFISEDTSENESEELVCGICGNEFNDKNSLMEHVKIHI